MGLYKTKLWPPFELGLFKICCIAFGMILGAFVPEFVKHYLWVFAAVVAVTMIRVLYFYFAKKN